MRLHVDRRQTRRTLDRRQVAFLQFRGKERGSAEPDFDEDIWEITTEQGQSRALGDTHERQNRKDRPHRLL